MQINPLTGQRISDKRPIDKTRSTRSTSFFDLLADQLQPPDESQAPAAAGPPAAEAPQVPVELRLAGLSVSEETIDLLDSFSQALGDLHLSSSDLLPLLEALEGETTTLLDILGQLPENDSLAQLIDRVATITAIEAEKFRRGDYH